MESGIHKRYLRGVLRFEQTDPARPAPLRGAADLNASRIPPGQFERSNLLEVFLWIPGVIFVAFRLRFRALGHTFEALGPPF